MELLAPAGSIEIGKLAIRCGADAVYVGASQFGARKNAANSVQEIAQLITFAHRYMAKVYVALNTILSEAEIVAAQKLLQELYDVGVDSVIIQDMGLLEAGIPPMPVIASTQTHNFDAEGIRFLENIGIRRVILARELRPNEIAKIRKQTDHIELEAFVHGALCVGYSGRCYLSHTNGGRSANKGNCAQPCRKLYSLLDGNNKIVKTGHLLSVKDMCRLDTLESLIDAGVTSFKIEGRLKSAGYVANTVTAYRRKIDTILRRRGLPKSYHRFSSKVIPDVTKTFHRGYVSHFAVNNDKMAQFKTPKMIGEFIGQVTTVAANHIELNTTTKLHAGDGLCFFSGNKLTGTRIQRIEGKKLILLNTRDISKGMTLYRNKDHEFNSALESDHPQRIVPLQMNVIMREGNLILQVSDDAGHRIEIERKGAFEPARNEKQMFAAITKQLQKTGASVFEVTNLTLNANPIPFLKVSALNAMRRDAVDAMEKARNATMMKQRDAHAFKFAAAVYPKKVDPYHNVANPFAVQFYQRCGATEVNAGVEFDAPAKNTKIMTSRYCIRRELGACLKTETGNTLVGPLSVVEGDNETQPLQLKFNCNQCEMEVHR